MVGILDLLFPPDELKRGKAGDLIASLTLPKLTPGGGQRFMPTNPPVPTERPETAQPAPQEAAPGGVDPMQTASTGPSGADPYLGWQRGMGSSGGPDQTGTAGSGGASGGGGGGLNWRELLSAIGPALMMADPLGRNQGMAAALMRRNDQRKEDAKTSENQNATKKWLLTQGMDDGTASMMVSDPVLLRQWFGERGKKPEQTDFDKRAAAASAYGLDPNSEAGRNFILSGDLPGTARGESKPASIAEFEYGQTNPDYAEWMKTKGRDAPLTATDKKAILDADEAVLANQNAIEMLDSVIAEPNGPGTSLNDRAGYGASAKTQAWLARNDPTGFFDDSKGEATTELENVVLNQALANLKSIFGAAPTEGERQILVDLQASVDKTPQERKLIIERAKELAGKRLQFNRQRAENLRNNEFYRPAGTGSPQTPPSGTADVSAKPISDMTDEELEAIANGR